MIIVRGGMANGKRGLHMLKKTRKWDRQRWDVRADELKTGNYKKYYKEGTFSH